MKDQGYAIRGESKQGPNTQISFVTTGVILRRLSAGGDADLEGVSHIVVDEVCNGLAAMDVAEADLGTRAFCRFRFSATPIARAASPEQVHQGTLHDSFCSPADTLPRSF